MLKLSQWHKRQWFSGKIQHPHCWAPSSILGWRRILPFCTWNHALSKYHPKLPKLLSTLSQWHYLCSRHLFFLQTILESSLSYLNITSQHRYPSITPIATKDRDVYEVCPMSILSSKHNFPFCKQPAFLDPPSNHGHLISWPNYINPLSPTQATTSPHPRSSHVVYLHSLGGWQDSWQFYHSTLWQPTMGSPEKMTMTLPNMARGTINLLSCLALTKTPAW